MNSLVDGRKIKDPLYNNQVVSAITAQLRASAVAHRIPVVGVSETLPPHLTFQQWQLRQTKALAAALAH